MRKLGGRWWVASAVVMTLAACQVAPAATAAPQTASSAVVPADAKSDGTGYTVERPHMQFAYSWPKEANAHPQLVDYFHTDAAQMLTELDALVAEDERLSDPNYEYKPTYSSETSWMAEAQTDGLISLSGSWYTYMGGAHGMYGVRALVFDKGRGEMVLAQDMMADADGFRAAIEEEFCRLLNTEREKRRGEPVDQSDMFGECVNLLDQTLIWKSTGGGAFDRLEVFIGPYEAGSYAEGSYLFNLPLTAPMVAAIAPQYRGNFAVNGGNPYAVEDE